MKLAFSIAVFSMLQPRALSSILRGSVEKKLNTYHRRATQNTVGTGEDFDEDEDFDNDNDNDFDEDEETGVDGIQLDEGCADDIMFNPNFETCSSYEDCAPVCGGREGCCCVNSARPYCGFPRACNDFLGCVVGDITGGDVVDGVTTDDFGCIILSQEWCQFRNACVAIGTCVNVPTDNNIACAATNQPDGPEFFCAIRDDCILASTLSCPDTNPDPGCDDKRLIVGSITDQTSGNMYMFDRFHVTYDNPTIVRGRVANGGSIIGEFDFTLLHQEWKMTLGGQTCIDSAEIHVYLTESLRHVLHVCYNPGITQSSTTNAGGGVSGSIPVCGGPVPVSSYYLMQLLAS